MVKAPAVVKDMHERSSFSKSRTAKLFIHRLRSNPSRLPCAAYAMRHDTPLFQIIYEFEKEQKTKDNIKSGRWTKSEKKIAEDAIRSYRSGELVLPRDKSLRRHIADMLNCSAMRVSKKFALPPRTENPRDCDRGRHRPEYDRGGRWADVETNLARCMIDFFQSGLLPISPTMTIRRLLSRVLRCIPMRISKKFKGSSKPYSHYSRGPIQSAEAQIQQDNACEHLFRLEIELEQYLSRMESKRQPLSSSSSSRRIRMSDILN